MGARSKSGLFYQTAEQIATVFLTAPGTSKPPKTALCAAALLLCPLATGAGKLEDLTGDAYVLHSEVTPPAPTSSGKLNSFVEDGVIQVSDLKKVAKE